MKLVGAISTQQAEAFNFLFDSSPCKQILGVQGLKKPLLFSVSGMEKRRNREKEKKAKEAAESGEEQIEVVRNGAAVGQFKHWEELLSVLCAHGMCVWCLDTWGCV